MISSRSTWACELKCGRAKPHKSCGRHAPRERVSWNLLIRSQDNVILVTLHVSVWVEIKSLKSLTVTLKESRSTWACELKFLSTFTQTFLHYVTLHVSVWVEISLRSTSRTRKKVTLHVSVWVEISLTVVGSQLRMSRSTWACELKYQCCHMPERDN